MKRWILLALIGALSGAAQAQEPIDGSTYRQERLREERLRDGSVLRHGNDDARRLDQLQRMRQRSEHRVRQMRQPEQTSRPANSSKSTKNTVRTQ